MPLSLPKENCINIFHIVNDRESTAICLSTNFLPSKYLDHKNISKKMNNLEILMKVLNMSGILMYMLK